MNPKEETQSEPLGRNENQPQGRRHHHRRHHHRRLHTRKPSVWGMISAFLVTAFIVCSLAFTILAYLSNDWAHRDLLIHDGGTYPLTVPRSPRINCHIQSSSDIPHPPVPTSALMPRVTGNSTASTTTNSTATGASNVSASAATEKSSNHYIVNCNIPICDPSSDNPHLCQQLSLSRSLLYTSLALISTSLFLSVVMLVVLLVTFALMKTGSKPSSFASRAYSTWIPSLSFVTHLVLVSSVVAMITCHYFGFSATVDQQFPNGNSITQVGATIPSGVDPTNQITVPWVAGKGSLWMGLGWGFAVLAVLSWQGVWGVGSFQLATSHPRRPTEKEEYEEQGMNGSGGTRENHEGEA